MTLKKKGITGDHVVLSFVSHRIQPLQRRKVLNNFDNSLTLPALFSVVNPPENTWVSVNKHPRLLVSKPFAIMMNPLFAEAL